MYLFFDTETTGLPRDWRAPVTDVDNWPRMVQLGWVRCDPNGSMTAEECFIVRPDGFTIPAAATRVHGISTARAKKEGADLREILDRFVQAAAGASVVVAHNLDFDEKVLGAEFIRRRILSPLDRLSRICTMKQTTDYCRLPGPYGFKWPTLQELHEKVFGHPPQTSHDAMADAKTCALCYFELKKRKAL